MKAERRRVKHHRKRNRLIKRCVIAYFLAAGLWITVVWTLRRWLHNHYGVHGDENYHSPMGFDQWVLDLIPDRPGYFVDIGAFPESGFSNSRALEQHGWKGICADPIPRVFELRTCGYVPRPIGAETGDTAPPPAKTDCGEGGHNLSGSYNQNCSASRVMTMGIEELLSRAEAPPNIDYISVAARATGVPILDGFPWDRFCVHYWTFELDETYFEKEAEEINIRLAPHVCRTQSDGPYLWAACFCHEVAASPDLAAVESDHVGAGRPPGTASRGREGHRAAFQRSSSLSSAGGSHAGSAAAAAEVQSSPSRSDGDRISGGSAGKDGPEEGSAIKKA